MSDLNKLKKSLVYLFFSTIFLLGTQVGCACNDIAVTNKTNPNDPKQNQTKVTHPPCLKVTPVNFGWVPVRCPGMLKQDLEIKHLGYAHCPKVIQVQKVTIQASDKGLFELTQPLSFPQTVAAGQSLRLGLSFRPKVVGTATTQITLTTDAPQQTQLRVPLKGIGSYDQAGEDSFKQEALASDILFIVDNSCSMQEEQNNLASNFASFIQWAKQLKSDFHIGVITTQSRGPLAGCLMGRPGQQILTPQTPDLEKVFASNAKVGTHGNGYERGMEAAFLALNPPMINDPKCNKGFLRSHAVLSLIFLSDEPDQSAQSVRFYAEFFQELKGKGRAHMVRASAVVGPEKTGCSSEFGRAEPGPRYLELADKLGGVTASICQKNWAEPLKAMGLTSIISRFHFPLSKPAEAKSVMVFVNGKLSHQSETQGWQYDEKANRVSFRGAAIPPPGATITVKYLVRCPAPKTP